MITHDIKSALRNLRRGGIASAISVAGLAVALAGAALVYAYVRWESSFNTSFPNTEHVYRVVRGAKAGGAVAYDLRTSGPLGPTLKETYPEVESYLRLMRRRVFVGTGERGDTVLLCIADRNLFDFLGIDAAIPAGMLDHQNGVLLTASFAKTLFGDDDPVGRLVRMEETYRGDYHVAGVIPDPPANVTIRFDVLSFVGVIDMPTWAIIDWLPRNWKSIETFVRLRPDTDVAAFERKIQQLFTTYLAEVADHSSYHLQRFDDIYLRTLRDFDTPGLGAVEQIRYGDADRLRAASIVALVLILVACGNFVNLATARATLRHRGVGVRKAVGASRGALVRQLLVESSLMTALAMCLAAGIVALTIEPFRALVGSPVPLSALTWGDAVLLVFGAACIGLVAGAWPAQYLSRTPPAEAFRSTSAVAPRSGRLRFALVTLQFAASAILIAFTLVVGRQVDHLVRQDLGFSRDLVIAMKPFEAANQTRYWGGYGFEFKNRYREVRDRFTSHPNVTAATGTRFGLTGYFGSTVYPMDSEVAEEVPVAFIGAEESFDEFFEVEILAGRGFTPETLDRRRERQYEWVVTELAARALGYQTPDEAIGKRLRWAAGETRVGPIVGVIGDLRLGSLKQESQPLMIVPDIFNMKTLYVRVKPDNLDETLAHLEATWKHYLPDRPFRFDFLDDEIARLYQAESGQRRVLSAFSWLSVVVGVMGVFGLAAFIVERRLKEISVRKVLGASRGGLLALLLRDHLGLVAAAVLVATPVSIWLSARWLEDYATRIALGPAPFAAAAAVCLLAMLAAVAFHAARALGADPVEHLRQE